MKKLNHLTLFSGHNRVSDITEINENVWETISKFCESKRSRLFEDYFLEIEDNYKFFLCILDEKLIECNIITDESLDYLEIKNKYSIKNEHPLLTVEFLVDNEEDTKELDNVKQWAGDFERCIGHVLLSKIESSKIN